MRFIDVFAGCGGLSLGLLKAGWQGVAAIERNPMAFETLRHNLIEGKRYQFDWPEWLPRKAISCESLLDNYKDRLESLAGTIDVMVGGPPCQGFSLAGARNPADPRNKMAEQYLELVKIIRPKFIVIENVSGFNSKFDEAKKTEDDDDTYFTKSYADFISEKLKKIGYSVSRGKLNCADYGVPQNRHRYFILCTQKGSNPTLFESLKSFSSEFKELKSLNKSRPVSVYDAIADLEQTGKTLIESNDSPVKGFNEIRYQIPDILPPYLRLMRDDFKGVPNSLRIPKHKANTIFQFKRIQQLSEPGKSLPKEFRDELGLKKHAITVLAKNAPAPTITTLPDDVIHYSEPRILTARETARVQSFPDWFEFTGKYTTGGKSRKSDCPRYTQIGNAVPPLISEAIGIILRQQIHKDALLDEKSKK